MSAEIEQTLIKFIAKHAEVKPSTLRSSMAIKDTGIDSIGIAELMFDIEEHYNLVLDNAAELQDRFELGTIKDLAEKLRDQIENQVELEV